MSKKPSDWQVREQVIQPNQSYLIQAPAGSGKTELVTDRILSLLAIVNKPEHIVAITFTRKAAAEMRQRVIEKLKLGQQQTEPQASHLKTSWQLAKNALLQNTQQQWNLLQYPERLKIITFDSLCASLVKAMPNSTLSGDALGITENSRFLYQKAVRRVLNKIEGTDQKLSAALEFWLYHLNLRFEGFEDSLVELLATRDHWVEQINDKDSEIILSLVKGLYQLTNDCLNDAVKYKPLGFSEEYAQLYSQWASSYEDIQVLENLHLKPLENSYEDLARWKALARALLTQKLEVKKKVDKNQGVPAGDPKKKALMQSFDLVRESPQFVETLKVISQLPDTLNNHYKNDMYLNLSIILKALLNELQEVFKEEGLVDFTEIALRAVKGLGSDDNPTDLLLKLDNQIDHLLIDEFQDTSLLQINLIKKITQGWQIDDGRTLLMVGDPMQSIYRFRKAEVGLFIEVAEKQALHHLPIKTVTLRENFRSQQGIVDWVNETFNEVFPKEDDVYLGAVKYSHSVPFHELKDSLAVQHHIDYSCQDKNYGLLSPEEAEESSYKKVALLVQNALKKYPDAENPVAVLVKTRTQLKQLSNYLKQQEIPVKAVKMTRLSHQIYIQDLLQLIRFLSHPADRVAFISLLRSPLCGLTLNTLSILFEDKESSSFLPIELQQIIEDESLEYKIDPSEYYRLQRFLKILCSPLTEGDVSFTMQLSYLWDRLGANLLYSTETAQVDIETVLLQLDEMFPYGNIDLELFEEVLSDLYSAAEFNSPAVEIMTIHQSKGLQFEEVIIYGLNNGRRPDGSPLLRIENYPTQNANERLLLLAMADSKHEDYEKDTLIDILKKNEKDRSLHEEKRLLYVAATRAKQTLHLCSLIEYRVKQNSKKTEGFKVIADGLLSWIDFTLPDLPKVDAAKNVESLTINQNDVAAEIEFNKGPELLRIHENDLKTHDHQYALKLPINSHSLATNNEQLWYFTSGFESIIGNLVHAWLYQMAFHEKRCYQEQEVLERRLLFKTYLKREGVPQAELESATETVIELLLNAINDQKLQKLFVNDNVKYEWPLYNTEGKQYIIDVVQSTPETWQLIDYKTSKRNNQESTEAFIQRLKLEYQEQIAEYARYLKHLHDKPIKAHLFVLSERLWIDMS